MKNVIVTDKYIKQVIDNDIYLSLDEDQLKYLVKETLEEHFIIKGEQTGYHLLEQREIRIDFLMYPKQKLIDLGFEKLWFGCEVKSPSAKQEAKKRVLNLAKQCIDYTETKFENGIIPNFVVMFPSMPHFYHAQNCLNDETVHFLSLFKPFLQRFKVGTLHIYSINNWAINFGHGLYFSTTRGKGKVINLGTKRHIGSV